MGSFSNKGSVEPTPNHSTSNVQRRSVSHNVQKLVLLAVDAHL